MRETKKSKGFSYYFRIEFSSLQGKITTGFCTLGLISIGLISITASLLKPSLEKSTYINQVIYPSHLQLAALEKNLDALIASGKQAHLFQQTSLDEEELRGQMATVRQPLDSLMLLAPLWQSKEEQLSLQMTANKTEAVLEKISAVNTNRNKHSLETIYGQDLPLLQRELQKNLLTITGKQAVLRQDYSSFIQQRLNNFDWILALCFVGAFVIGTSIGSFIVVKVLAVIRHLKYKILELSEGNLIDPIPPSKDELNSIGKAVNTLTDNLRDIREFAREVGQGNFDTDISVFNNQNDLGQSLAEMRESLKRVAEEDKIRAWTANGLATFNEFLRNTSNEIEQFEMELCSKVVKYLEVNQGALYIARAGENKKVQLELKACYAYDRQKFIKKTIEAGQGFVGQAYLEKEYICLSDIPERFTTITSGLGEASPRHLLVMPLKINQEVKGVFELASFTALPAYKISFIEKLAESIASAIGNLQSSQMTYRLLEEAREMADTMKAQEESLRQNSEELQATQEQLEREMNELRNELSLAEGALSSTEIPVLIVSENQKIQWINQAAEKTLGNTLLHFKGTSLAGIFSAQEYSKLTAAMEAAGQQAPLVECKLILKKETVRLKANSFNAGQQKYYSIQLEPLPILEQTN